MARTSIKERDNRVNFVKELLNSGKKKWEIIEHIKQKYNVSRTSAYDYINRSKALK